MTNVIKLTNNKVGWHNLEHQAKNFDKLLGQLKSRLLIVLDC